MNRTSFVISTNTIGAMVARLMKYESSRLSGTVSNTSATTADHAGPQPDRKDGSCFTWKQR